MRSFLSCFGPCLTEYVALRQKLGFQFQTQAEMLIQFDRYAHARNHSGPITAELITSFATADSISDVRQVRRYQVVRNFTDYLAIHEPATPLMDPGFIRRPARRRLAHIYSDAEMMSLLDAAKKVSRLRPMRGASLHAMVGLAAATGLRISEVIRLDRRDVDLRTGALSVLRTKFAKDRLVPVHASTLEILRGYAERRDAHFGALECPAFFINLCGRRYSRHTLELDFWRLGRATGLREAKGKGPRFHDLRHSYAVKRLAEWYREGIDVQAMLPVLATYMGHVNYTTTAYYLSATAELLGLAAERFVAFAGATKEVAP